MIEKFYISRSVNKSNQKSEEHIKVKPFADFVSINSQTFLSKVKKSNFQENL